MSFLMGFCKYCNWFYLKTGLGLRRVLSSPKSLLAALGLRRKQFFSEGFCSAPLHGASLLFVHFLWSHKENEPKESAHELMRFLLRKIAAGPCRSRLSFRFAKRHSAWSTAIAGNSGFLFANIRLCRMGYSDFVKVKLRRNTLWQLTFQSI